MSITTIQGLQGTTGAQAPGRLRGTISISRLKGPTILPGAHVPQIKAGLSTPSTATPTAQIRRKQDGGNLAAIAATLANKDAYGKWNSLRASATPLSGNDKGEFTKITCTMIRKSLQVDDAVTLARDAINVIRRR